MRRFVAALFVSSILAIAPQSLADPQVMPSFDPKDPNYYPSLLATFSQLAYDPYSAPDKLPKEWSPVLTTNPTDNPDEFKAISAYNQNNGVLIVAIAGTDFISTSDLLEDLQIAAHTVASLAFNGSTADQVAEHLSSHILTTAQQLALKKPHDILTSKVTQTTKFIEQSKYIIQSGASSVTNYEQRIITKVILVGHSSGGLHAAIAGAQLGITSVTFNAPWIPVTVAHKFGIPLGADDKAFNFARLGDPIAVGDVFGKAVVPRVHNKTLDPHDVNPGIFMPFHQHFLELTKRSAILDKPSVLLFAGPSANPQETPVPRAVQANTTPSANAHLTSNSREPGEFGTPLMNFRVKDESETQVDTPKPDPDPPSTPNNQPIELRTESYTFDVQPVEPSVSGTPSDDAVQTPSSQAPVQAPVIVNPLDVYTEDQWIDRSVEGILKEQTDFLNKYFKDNPPNVDPVPPGVTDTDGTKSRDGVVVWTIMVNRFN